MRSCPVEMELLDRCLFIVGWRIDGTVFGGGGVWGQTGESLVVCDGVKESGVGE